jgi:hypothetical protein
VQHVAVVDVVADLCLDVGRATVVEGEHAYAVDQSGPGPQLAFGVDVVGVLDAGRGVGGDPAAGLLACGGFGGGC